MTNIHLVAVTYNSNDALNKYLDSIESAAALCPDLHLQVSIADNGSNESFVQAKQYNFSLNCHKFDNPGYLGGALKIINKSDSTAFDYTIISNVDICLDHDFFVNLAKLDTDPSVGWIAPRVWSISESRNRNPFMNRRSSKLKLELLKVSYKYPIINKVYTNTLYKRKKIAGEQSGCQIYAGHGSMFILSKFFFEKNNTLQYPVFLYGEEIFMAELCRENNLKVLYCPQIQIVSTDHISVKNIKKDTFYKYNYLALSYLLSRFSF